MELLEQLHSWAWLRDGECFSHRCLVFVALDLAHRLRAKRSERPQCAFELLLRILCKGACIWRGSILKTQCECWVIRKAVFHFVFPQTIFYPRNSFGDYAGFSYPTSKCVLWRKYDIIVNVLSSQYILRQYKLLCMQTCL